MFKDEFLFRVFFMGSENENEKRKKLIHRKFVFKLNVDFRRYQI